MPELKVMTPAGSLHDAQELAPGSKIVLVDLACPGCGATPLQVEGNVPHVVRDTDQEHCTEWESSAICCALAGFTIGCRVVSLFGFEEDQAVLQGRPRVY